MATVIIQIKTGQRASEKNLLDQPQLLPPDLPFCLMSDFTARMQRPALVWWKIQKLSDGWSSVSLANMLLEAEWPPREEPCASPFPRLWCSLAPYLIWESLQKLCPYTAPSVPSLPTFPFWLPCVHQQRKPLDAAAAARFPRRTRPFCSWDHFPFSALHVADR